ncbi:MAG: hypothetical protein EBZ01_10055, partial [Betaproteobacteria bacterium]|nr:hypothetical protein [Betaproteobacteria bacterium]
FALSAFALSAFALSAVSAFALSASFIIGDILKTITNTDKTYINQVLLLDIFTGGKNLTNNQTSLTFRVKIKPTTQTLTAAEIEIISQKIIDNFERQASAFYTSARLLDDGLIDPRDTRKVLAFVLASCKEQADRKLQTIQFGVARP